MDNNNTERKTYNSPKLTEYGNVKDLTLSFGMRGTADGGTDDRGMALYTQR